MSAAARRWYHWAQAAVTLKSANELSLSPLSHQSDYKMLSLSISFSESRRRTGSFPRASPHLALAAGYVRLFIVRRPPLKAATEFHLPGGPAPLTGLEWGRKPPNTHTASPVLITFMSTRCQQAYIVLYSSAKNLHVLTVLKSRFVPHYKIN